MTQELTTHILVEIRDAIRETNGRIDATNERLDGLASGTHERLDALNGRIDNLARRQVEGEIRVATLLTQVAGDLREVKESLHGMRAVDAKVSDHETRIQRLEARQNEK